MTPPPRSAQKRDPETTRRRLLDAAMAEFNARGFDGTDSNRIARRAGYAPQTFYRHFDDKLAVFLAVYERWWQGEIASLEKAADGKAPTGAQAARVALAFHTRWRGFRRSLRHLAIVEPCVRKARTLARKAQIARMAVLSGRPEGGEVALVAALLTAERLSDAVADGELADLGLSRPAAEALVAEAMERLVGRREPSSADRGKRA